MISEVQARGLQETKIEWRAWSRVGDILQMMVDLREKERARVESEEVKQEIDDDTMSE